MMSIGLDEVSARESEVLDALRENLTNAEIGQRLHISVRTVESHVSSLLRKLGATDRRDLVTRAEHLIPRTGAATRDIAGLPSTWTTFVGRARELDELSLAITTDRLVTLVGPGGVGKTRLAMSVSARVASTFPAGGAFVDLVPVSSDFVVQAVAAALGVVERAQEPLEQAVHERLRAGRALLVLDNCEHVLGAVAAFVQSVLASCPAAVILTTSRERLGVTGERVVPVDPLALTGPGENGAASEAELLFVDRAASAAGADADPGLIAEICRRLDGMPLAIELAAARSSSLGLDGLLAGLGDHLRLLSRSSASGDRHGSLRTVIDWSYQLLDQDERAMFRRLGVFACSFDLEAASTVVSDDDLATTGDIIGRLADKSLLVHSRGDTGSRWWMLDTIHAYAGRAARSQRRADRRPPPLRPMGRRPPRASSSRRSTTTRTGSGASTASPTTCGRRSWSRLEHPATVTTSTWPSLSATSPMPRRFLGEARDHLETAVARAPDDVSAVAALRMAADAAFAEMRGDSSFDLLQAASARASAAGDRRVAAIALADASAIAGRGPAMFIHPLGHEQLVVFTDEARALAPPDDLEVATHIALAAAWNRACDPNIPDPDRADEALALARRLGDPVLISSALDAASAAVASRGGYKEASRLTAERLELLDRLPRHEPRVGGEVADIFHMATESALAAGELDDALASARCAHRDSISQGLAHFPATHLVTPLALQGSFDEALAQATVMREGWERSGRPAAGWMAPAFFAAAMVHGLRGDTDAYARWWHLATTIRMASTAKSFGLFVEPRVALHLGALDRARATAVTDEQDTVGEYGPYARAISVEVAVATGAPDAEKRLALAAHLARENDFVAAQLLRAAGRLHGDETELEQAVAAWEAIGARFERACTLVMLPARTAEGVSELTELGCPQPPPVGDRSSTGAR